jgi:probable HAF family extracellular repeat protein
MHTSLRGLTVAAAVALGGAAATALAVAGPANARSASTSHADGMSYHFQTLNNGADLTFNQLLGINDDDVIAGYYGSGAQGHPNKGYEVWPGSSGMANTYRTENFPHSVQTQVTGLNDEGVTVGFFSTMNTASMTDNNFGFYASNGSYHEVNFPTGDNASPQADQLLGVNDYDVAVGFYTNGQGRNRGYTYSIKTRQFIRVLPPGFTDSTSLESPSLTATAINDHGNVVGFYSKTSSQVDAFILRNGEFIALAVHGASMTQAFGVNNSDEVVGTYTIGTGNSAKTYGFTWQAGHGFTAVSDPHGIGATTINGVNDHGDLVGFYTDAAGNTDGMLAQP